MCLIIFSPNGSAIERDYWYSANQDNSDGIGVMSSRGVEKFFGKGQAKRGYNYMLSLAAESVPFATHFRWRTHGAYDVTQVHPHAISADVFLMHNGILQSHAFAAHKTDESDTALFCRDLLAPAVARGVDLSDIRELIEDAIGYGNKFVTYDRTRDKFTVFNASSGHWTENGLWHSNDYSLPGRSRYSGNSTTTWYGATLTRNPGGVVVTYSKPKDAEIDSDLAAAKSSQEFWLEKFCEAEYQRRVKEGAPTLADFNYDEAAYASELVDAEHWSMDDAWIQAEFEMNVATTPLEGALYQAERATDNARETVTGKASKPWSSYLTDMCAHCGLCDEVQIQACCGNHAEYVTPSSVIAGEIANEKPALLLPPVKGATTHE